MSRWLFALVLIAACRRAQPEPALRDSTPPLAIVRGLDGPEAVRYDPDQDVWFVANFAGADSGDGNGFIAKLDASGTIVSRTFMRGTMAPLDAPRGMYITGDTLWAADALGVHGFNRRTGAQLAFIDLSAWHPGFLNDIARGPDGALYVTDTRQHRVYRIQGRDVTVAIDDTTIGQPNGITWDPSHRQFLLAGFGRGGTIVAWRPAAAVLLDFGRSHLGRFDGIEIVDGTVLAACQADSTIRAIAGGVERVMIRTTGAPGDIGIDTRRKRIAVPYIELNRVEVWELR